MLGCPPISSASTKPTAHKSTITISIPIEQNLSFERHPNVSASNASVSERLDAATELLQKKNSPTDISCPVKMLLSGNVAAFTIVDIFPSKDIESQQDLNDTIAVADVDAEGVVVGKILFCVGPTIAYGCTIGLLGFNPMIFSSDADALWDGKTAAHEFGHFRGLDHVDQGNRIMYAPSSGQPRGSEDHVTSGECNAFKTPI